jgi:hypothetical protein
MRLKHRLELESIVHDSFEFRPDNLICDLKRPSGLQAVDSIIALTALSGKNC